MMQSASSTKITAVGVVTFTKVRFKPNKPAEDVAAVPGFLIGGARDGEWSRPLIQRAGITLNSADGLNKRQRRQQRVMSRGDRREDIFLEDVDRKDFIKTLAPFSGTQRLRRPRLGRTAPWSAPWWVFSS